MLQFQAERSMQFKGVVPVDKPVGVSSHTVVSWARKHLDIQKIGHTGTLDPLASGILILLIGREATVLQDTYLKQDKEYECTMRLGVGTDTLDCTGEVTERQSWDQVKTITKKQVTTAIAAFVGDQRQLVPVYSAIKFHGRKLYDLARQGRAMPKKMPERTISLYSLSLLDFHKAAKAQTLTVTFRVHCSSGTYVRVLAQDIGKKLGLAATVTALRRTRIGTLSLSDIEICPLIPKEFYLFENTPQI